MIAPNDADRPERRPQTTPPGPAQEWLLRSLAKASEWARELRRRERLLELLTLVALVGGALLIVADFTDLFNATTAKRGVFGSTTGGDNHSYALVVVGAAVICATLLARATEAWPPAGGVVVLGIVALVFVLAVDLPDATSSGLTTSVEIGKTEPAVGFWLELVGALVALAGGLALAYLLRRGAPKAAGRR
jgi:hypothetical protein